MPSDMPSRERDARERDARERTMCGRDVSGQARSLRRGLARGGVPRAIASTRTKIPAVRSIISDSGDSGEPSERFYIPRHPSRACPAIAHTTTTPAPRVVAIETRMALTDTTNVAAVVSPAGAETAALKAKPTGSTAPNPEKLGIALDAVAGFDAAARDDATAKLEAAAFKDAAGLCIALLGVASDSGCASARRLAAATFTRNCLRKQWGARDETTTREPARVTPEARADVRGASCARSSRRRRTPDACSRTACASPRRTRSGGRRPEPPTREMARPSPSPRREPTARSSGERRRARRGRPRRLRGARVLFLRRKHHERFARPLLAAHVASMPFQYFRDPTVAFEAAHPAAERLSASLVAPRLVPALTRAAAADFTNDRDAAQFARVAFKIVHRLVRAHMPAAIAPALPEVVGAIEAACAARAAEAGETELSSAEISADVSWVAAKRALRLGAALVTRHADALDAASIASLARSGLAIAALRPGLAPTPSAAAAFALLRATLERAATRDALLFATNDSKNERLEERTNDSSEKARRVALARLVRACVVPHVCLTEEDESSLASDPEEYAAPTRAARRRRTTPCKTRWTETSPASRPGEPRWISSRRSRGVVRRERV